MAFSYLEYTGNGSTASFAYGSIDLFSNADIPHSSQLSVYVDGVLQTLTTHYTLDTASEEVDFVSPPASLAAIKIERDTKITSRYVDFTNNSVIEEQTLDQDSNQMFFLIQELTDGLANALTLDDDGYWNGQGHASRNCLPADSGSGWVTLEQMQNAIVGIDTATVDNATQWSFTGDGAATGFELSGLGLNIVPEQLWVWLNGVIQKPGTDGPTFDYYIDNSGTDPVVEFNFTPANGDTVEIRAIHGTVAAIFDEVDGTIITDYSIDPLTKLQTSAGDNTRVIIIGSSGRVSTIRQLVANDISNFETAVTGYSLDEFTTAAGNYSMGGNQITSLAAGTSSGHAVNKGQMDTAIAALSQSKVAVGNMGTLSVSAGAAVNLGWQPDMVTFIQTDVDALAGTKRHGNQRTEIHSGQTGYQEGTPIGNMSCTFSATGFSFTPSTTGVYHYIAYKNA